MDRSLPPPGRRPKGREGELYDLLTMGGLRVTGRGWPDFTTWGSGGTFAVVEALRHAEEEMKPSQAAVLEALAGHGVPVYTWSPDGGFVPYPPQRDDVPPTPFDLEPR